MNPLLCARFTDAHALGRTKRSFPEHVSRNAPCPRTKRILPGTCLPVTVRLRARFTSYACAWPCELKSDRLPRLSLSDGGQGESLVPRYSRAIRAEASFLSLTSPKAPSHGAGGHFSSRLPNLRTALINNFCPPTVSSRLTLTSISKSTASPSPPASPLSSLRAQRCRAAPLPRLS